WVACGGACGGPPPEGSLAAAGPAVVGATVFALRGFWEAAPFGWVILDEASQMPCAHALCALLSGRRPVLFGDPMQLGPILAGEHRDPIGATSIFSHLAGGGGAPPTGGLEVGAGSSEGQGTCSGDRRAGEAPSETSHTASDLDHLEPAGAR